VNPVELLLLLRYLQRNIAANHSHFPTQLGVAGFVHFADSARADGRKDFVGTESCANRDQLRSNLVWCT
jgi:hypothetical protein